MTKTRKRYTEQERASILSAAASNGMTGKQAAKRFGVSEVTLWKWRRDAKTAHARRPRKEVRNGSADDSLASMVRAEVQARVRELVPAIIHEEIAQAFGSKRRT